jgi:hypothetical protein
LLETVSDSPEAHGRAELLFATLADGTLLQGLDTLDDICGICAESTCDFQVGAGK